MPKELINALKKRGLFGPGLEYKNKAEWVFAEGLLLNFGADFVADSFIQFRVNTNKG